MIKLKEIIEEGGKLFGSRAKRVTTSEMNSIFSFLQSKLGNSFSKMKLSKALPDKKDHGDVDIVVSTNKNIKEILYSVFGNSILDFSKNGNISSILLHDVTTNKNVHVDFINSSEDQYDAQFDYLSYNDFSGILGVMARRLNFKYSSEGFFKRYVDSAGRWHSILLTRSLRDGLKILGYEKIMNSFDDIKSIDDIVNFIASSDLFSSEFFAGMKLNSSDRKRMRADRPSAQEIRNKLIGIGKWQEQLDEDYYLKKFYPNLYKKLLEKEKEIEEVSHVKSKYGGDWIMQNFPEVKPGMVIGKIKSFWSKRFGNNLDSVPEKELRKATSDFLKNL